MLATGWDHVVAQPMPLLGEELLATVQKLRRADVFGLEKYMAWGAEVRSHALGEPNRLTEVIALLDTRYKPTELARSASFHAFTAS